VRRAGCISGCHWIIEVQNLSWASIERSKSNDSRTIVKFFQALFKIAIP
jgi:hypothetical protein